jgi:hypothetical protein
MGTKGISGFKCGGEYKLFYNGLDGYPSGLGQKTVDFANRMNRVRGWDHLRKNCENLEVVPFDSKPTREQIERNKRYAWSMDTPYSGRPEEWDLDNWFQLQSGLEQGAFFDEVYAGNVEEIQDGRGSGASYMYILNLDAKEIDFYLDKDYADEEGLEPVDDPSKKISSYHSHMGSCPVELRPHEFSLACHDWHGKFYGELD